MGGPRRLIEVGSDNDHLKLVENFHQIPKYAALSYCWGGDQDYKTTSSNIMSYQQRLRLPAEAKTILDAISVTRRLGLKYLWVDALCITQDKPVDMNAELVRMSDIYKAAYVTIVPATSENSKTGFLEPRRPSKPMYRLPYRCPIEELGSIVLFYGRREYYEYPIDARAWAFQEEIMSTRIIRFENDMLWWWCDYGVKSDGGEYHQFRPRNRRLSGDSEKAMEEWKTMVEIYTRRRLTNQTDKFNAIASIAAEVAQILKSNKAGISARYVAGLWQVDLPAQLLWYTGDGPSIVHPIPKSYRAPSWSWGSIDDSISFWDSGDSLHGKIRCKINLENENLPYGRAESGFLATSGCVKKALWAKERDHIQDENFPNTGLEYVAFTEADYLQDCGSDNQDIEVWCLAMAENRQSSERWGTHGKIAGLILRPLEISDQFTRSKFDWLKNIMSRDSVLKDDGVYWDRRSENPILRHSHPDVKTKGEVSLCESYLFRRVGFFELFYKAGMTNGSVDRATESQMEKAQERSMWFDDCSRYLVYIV